AFPTARTKRPSPTMTAFARRRSSITSAIRWPCRTMSYDPIVFLPDQNKTIAQISSEEKHAISHRGKAVRALQNIIEKI
ncbi:MAG: hypothetical protein IJ937_05505, partial [Treponema sp.]|nr:hypothetical protein [Treponema sp.]